MADIHMLETPIAADDAAEAFDVAPVSKDTSESPIPATKPGSNEDADSPLLQEDVGDSPKFNEMESTPPNDEEEAKYQINVTEDIDTKEEEVVEDKGPKVIYQVFDTEQKIPDKVQGKGPNALNEVDPEWKYNITLGDMEFRRIVHDQSLVDAKVVKKPVEELWFPMERYPDDYDPALGIRVGSGGTAGTKDTSSKKKGKPEKPPRKVFVAFKVKRVSDVDNIKETVSSIDFPLFLHKFHYFFRCHLRFSEYNIYS